MRFKSFFLVAALSLLLAAPAGAQVLGPCGSSATEAAAGTDVGSALLVQPIPLPGQQAIDFELAAVVGDDIKNIKLSDYNGKWRVLCFFPAAFTFV